MVKAPSQRPWKTLINIVSISGFKPNRVVNVILPGWNSSKVIPLSESVIPAGLHEHLQPGARFFAMVNKGAEDKSDLHFDEFEVAPVTGR